MNHAEWKRWPRKSVEAAAGTSLHYVEAGYAFALGQAVYDRRTELGLSQAEVARRAGMTQPQVSNVEGGDSVPTLPVLIRLAKALEASLTIALDGDASAFVFTAHDTRGPDEAPPGGRTAAA
ncbi:helix-turn-helix domain-containing protein [Kitasatospora sp. NPDC051853]|uniref:helix-turn-helix domain-containing protein n=1 Tax=Kitasatospora sp. NPDC051853 TaxID=3364058 RepID=UPI0037A2D758